MKTYNKLVRDRIPEIIEAEGKIAEVRTLSGDELIQAVKAKIVEEAREILAAEDSDLAAEIADLQEVLETLVSLSGLSAEALADIRQEKNAARGEFKKGFFLVSVDE